MTDGQLDTITYASTIKRILRREDRPSSPKKKAHETQVSWAQAGSLRPSQQVGVQGEDRRHRHEEEDDPDQTQVELPQ
jgi:hypothetical protein